MRPEYVYIARMGKSDGNDIDVEKKLGGGKEPGVKRKSQHLTKVDHEH